MKKLNAIFLIVVFVVSMFICSCSASGGVSIGKQQNSNTVKSNK
jgi:hypothetical protein